MNTHYKSDLDLRASERRYLESGMWRCEKDPRIINGFPSKAHNRVRRRGWAGVVLPLQVVRRTEPDSVSGAAGDERGPQGQHQGEHRSAGAADLSQGRSAGGG